LFLISSNFVTNCAFSHTLPPGRGRSDLEQSETNEMRGGTGSVTVGGGDTDVVVAAVVVMTEETGC
jgi:hypothetical protein